MKKKFIFLVLLLVAFSTNTLFAMIINHNMSAVFKLRAERLGIVIIYQNESGRPIMNCK